MVRSAGGASACPSIAASAASSLTVHEEPARTRAPEATGAPSGLTPVIVPEEAAGSSQEYVKVYARSAPAELPSARVFETVKVPHVGSRRFVTWTTGRVPSPISTVFVATPPTSKRGADQR